MSVHTIHMPPLRSHQTPQEARQEVPVRYTGPQLTEAQRAKLEGLAAPSKATHTSDRIDAQVTYDQDEVSIVIPILDIIDHLGPYYKGKSQGFQMRFRGKVDLAGTPVELECVQCWVRVTRS
jgi:hypothetical protein